VLATSGTYPWSFVTQVLCNGNHVMVAIVKFAKICWRVKQTGRQHKHL